MRVAVLAFVLLCLVSCTVSLRIDRTRIKQKASGAEPIGKVPKQHAVTKGPHRTAKASKAATHKPSTPKPSVKSGAFPQCPPVLFPGCYGKQRAYIIDQIKNNAAAFCASGKLSYSDAKEGAKYQATVQAPTGSTGCSAKTLNSNWPNANCDGAEYVTNAPAGAAPVILGFGKDINNVLTAKGETAPGSKNYWRLWAKPDGCWTWCFNFAFLLCGAKGALPKMSGGEFEFATNIGSVTMEYNGSCVVTANEVCLLKSVCTTPLTAAQPVGKPYTCGTFKTANLK